MGHASPGIDHGVLFGLKRGLRGPQNRGPPDLCRIEAQRAVLVCGRLRDAGLGLGRLQQALAMSCPFHGRASLDGAGECMDQQDAL